MRCLLFWPLLLFIVFGTVVCWALCVSNAVKGRILISYTDLPHPGIVSPCYMVPMAVLFRGWCQLMCESLCAALLPGRIHFVSLWIGQGFFRSGQAHLVFQGGDLKPKLIDMAEEAQLWLMVLFVQVIFSCDPGRVTLIELCSFFN